MGESTKKRSELGYIGNKGIGFKSVFKLTACPEVHSRNFHFRFDARSEGLSFVLPLPIDAPADWDASQGTLIRLPLAYGQLSTDGGHSRFAEERAHAATNFRRQLLRDVHSSTLLFLHRLRSIHVHDGDAGVTRELHRRDIGHGLVLLEETEPLVRLTQAGSVARSASERKHSKDIWLCTSQTVEASNEEGVRPTVMTVAIPWLDDEEDAAARGAETLAAQDVFAYLPLRSYGFKFVLQADWDIPAARESIDATSSW